MTAELQVRFVDVGCGFGGLLIRLAPLYPDKLMLGFELRDKVRLEDFAQHQVVPTSNSPRAQRSSTSHRRLGLQLDRRLLHCTPDELRLTWWSPNVSCAHELLQPEQHPTYS